jgi:hypothetical protein
VFSFDTDSFDPNPIARRVDSSETVDSADFTRICCVGGISQFSATKMAPSSPSRYETASLVRLFDTIEAISRIATHSSANVVATPLPLDFVDNKASVLSLVLAWRWGMGFPIISVCWLSPSTLLPSASVSVGFDDPAVDGLDDGCLNMKGARVGFASAGASVSVGLDDAAVEGLDDGCFNMKGARVGFGAAACVGLSEGGSEGKSEGISEGGSEGRSEGNSEGNSVGTSEGNSEGASDKYAEGSSDGNVVGAIGAMEIL